VEFGGALHRIAEQELAASLPFETGRPMAFLRQFEMGTTPPEAALGLPRKTLYVFAAKAPSPHGGWEMRYRVVQDDVSTKGLATVPGRPWRGDGAR
jgi:hypothetical protein